MRNAVTCAPRFLVIYLQITSLYHIFILFVILFTVYLIDNLCVLDYLEKKFWMYIKLEGILSVFSLFHINDSFVL